MRAESGSDVSLAGSAPTEDGTVELRPAALDAYRVSIQLDLTKKTMCADRIDIQRPLSIDRKPAR